MINIYIGEFVYWKLPEEEKKKFELFESYKPDYMNESIRYMEENDESEEWYDECFKDLEDYENFMGGDWDSSGGSVYKRTFEVLTKLEEKYFQDLAYKEEGNPIRIKNLEDDDEDVDWEVWVFKRDFKRINNLTSVAID